MRGMPFHKSLIDQASSVQISGYSKKANALIQLTIYDKENDPILEWGQSTYQSLAATTNSLSRTQWEGLRVGQFLHWRFLIFFRKVVHKRQPTKLGFSSPLLNTTTWLWTFTSTWHLNIAWKRLSLLRCKQMSYPYSTRDKYLQGTQKAVNRTLPLTRSLNLFDNKIQIKSLFWKLLQYLWNAFFWIGRYSTLISKIENLHYRRDWQSVLLQHNPLQKMLQCGIRR